MKNKYTLSCLIPMHYEGEDIIKPLLDSIAIQQNIDFNTIEAVITHDGIIPEDADYKLSKKFLKQYPFKITYLEKEHEGVSAARNYCLDHCSGKYVMFMDADDMLFSACGLWMIYNEISNGDFDMYASKFVEEVRLESGEPFYINRDNDSTFVHGKVLRRQFLIDNDIRWNESLTIHEDSFFNCTCQQLAARRENGYKYTTTSYYLWKWRPNSVCRQDPKYLLKTFTNMLDSNTALVNNFLNRNEIMAAASTVVNMVYETYFSLNKLTWLDPENKEYRDATEKRFKQYWESFRGIFYTLPNQQHINLVKKQREKFYDRGLIHEQITFDDWIKHIEGLED